MMRGIFARASGLMAVLPSHCLVCSLFPLRSALFLSRLPLDTSLSPRTPSHKLTAIAEIAEAAARCDSNRIAEAFKRERRVTGWWFLRRCCPRHGATTECPSISAGGGSPVFLAGVGACFAPCKASLFDSRAPQLPTQQARLPSHLLCIPVYIG